MNQKEKTSKRHHYIPKFLIKGFTNEKGFLFIYDKGRDKILDNTRSPKSMFFQEHRNSIKTIDDNYSSILEDVFFQRLDNASSIAIQSLQSDSIEKGLLSQENLGQLMFFVINLFWRIPATDYAVKDLIRRADIKANIDSEVLRNDTYWHKLERSKLYKETVDQIIASDTKRDHYYPKISEFEDDVFLLGDYPFIYKSYLSQFKNLGEDDYIIALSKNRIISSTDKPTKEFTKKMAYDYNSIIIDQSKKYICSSNLELLKKSIQHYKELKNRKIFFFIKPKLFEEK